MLTTANRRPPTQPIPGIAAGATPPGELEEAEEDVVERVAVESPVEDAEVLMSDELEDLLPVKEAAEPESEGAELALTMLLVDPLVAKLDADNVDTRFELDTDIGVAIKTELGTCIVIPVAVAAAAEMESKATEINEDSAARLAEA
ncbi:hypothetical protein M436DRAFT_67018 [Aureobasidium namibiae CBS 147.97]|uniref:Uncharacterized protein n=1 Tax=Aureobasidium namibiae CBS 147.97 TaxID=1043004 RepID=A0A074WIW4_9PEZI